MNRISTVSDLARYDSDLANNPYRSESYHHLHLSSQSNNNNARNPTTNNNNSRNKNKKNGKCLNPNNQWIIDLFTEKSQKQTGNEYQKNAYVRAIKNIKKYPFAITNEHNAMEVDGIGKSFAKMIMQKLIQKQQYVSQDVNQARQNARQDIEKQHKNEAKASKKRKKSPKKKRRRKKPPKGPKVPRQRTGGYAILVHMYDSWKNGVQGILKQQLIRDAQQYTESSFTESKNGYHTAWSGMSKLIKQGYVQSISHGNKGTEFILQPAGKAVAHRLHAALFGDPMPPEPDRSIFNEIAWPRGISDEDEDDDEVVEEQSKPKKSKPKFKCPYCNKSYVQKKSYDSHIENKHKNGENISSNCNQNGRKRKNNDMMDLDDDIQIMQPMAKRARIEYAHDNFNNNSHKSMEAMKINGEWYELCLVYDTSEEQRKNRNERVCLDDEFNKQQQIRSIPYRLPIGDFCWLLINTNNRFKQYLYPVIVERKRMDDLAKSIQDKRYIEQKWRIKKNLPYFRHIYLIEEKRLDNESMRKRVTTALINTQVRDGFLIYHTKSMIECIRVLSKWTHLIYQQILNKLNANRNNNYDFFNSEQCLLFDKFNKLTEVKKNLNIPAKILFGRQLMAINGVTDIIAWKIVLKYPTMRVLYNAWDDCDDEQEAKLFLYKQVNATCLEWHRDLDSGRVDLDEDLRNVCNAMDNAKFKPISKKLSEKIWNALYHAR